jgi:hypothetical protein
MPAQPTDVKQAAPRVVKKRRAPKRWPCPVCGKPGRRERERTYTVRHLAHKEPVVWEVTVGVYRAKCTCRRVFMRKVEGRVVPVRKRVKYFTSTVEGVAQGAEYTDAVRQKIVDLVVRDRLPNSLVIKHLKEDFLIDVSVGFIYNCLDRAQKGAA